MALGLAALLLPAGPAWTTAAPTPASQPGPALDATALRATVPPPDVTLVYDLRRGRMSGRGELRLQRSGDTYELKLTGSVIGIRVLDQVSSGRFDRAGFAPDRFSDTRLGRDPRIAEFLRGSAPGSQPRIRYTGGDADRPLPPGAQDRLSWMLQLAAIAQARPLQAGESVDLYVSGSRGDADTWRFRVLDRPQLDVQGRSIPTLHLQREPRHEGDGVAEIWLDPARHHLPVRAHLGSDGDKEALELQLQRLDPTR